MWEKVRRNGWWIGADMCVKTAGKLRGMYRISRGFPLVGADRSARRLRCVDVRRQLIPALVSRLFTGCPQAAALCIQFLP